MLAGAEGSIYPGARLSRHLCDGTMLRVIYIARAMPFEVDLGFTSRTVERI